MMPQHPLPVLDLSSCGFLACLAVAGRAHVGDHTPEDRPRAARDPQHDAWASRTGSECLYCREKNAVGGEEHILSVALGNWFWTLPENVVCDRCNNRALSVLDTALLKHPLIGLVRTLANVHGRSGQAPHIGASNMRVARDARGDLVVQADHARHVKQSPDEVLLRPAWANHGPKQRRQTARALLKVALGTIWLAKGPDETHRPKYDHVRDAVRGDKQVPLHHGFGNTKLPSHAIQILVVSHEEARGFRVTVDTSAFNSGLRLTVDESRPRTRSCAERYELREFSHVAAFSRGGGWQSARFV